jgi:hypothetical protein
VKVSIRSSYRGFRIWEFEFRRIRIQALDNRSPEIVKEPELSVRERTRVAKSPISGIQTSGVIKGSLLTSRLVKSRENCSHPSEEDRKHLVLYIDPVGITEVEEIFHGFREEKLEMDSVILCTEP